MVVKIKKSLRLPHTKVCGLFGTFGCSRFNSTLKCGVLIKNLDITNLDQNNKARNVESVYGPLLTLEKNLDKVLMESQAKDTVYLHEDLINEVIPDKRLRKEFLNKYRKAGWKVIHFQDTHYREWEDRYLYQFSPKQGRFW